MDPVKTECESLRDLKAILARTEEYGLRLLVMGGWAVTAYVGRHRYTKDIDLVAAKVVAGHVQGILKGFGYSVADRAFGLACEKRNEGIDLRLHISVGSILDESRPGKPLRYLVSDEAFRQAPLLCLHSYHPQCRQHEFKAPVLPLDDLFIAKVLPIGREEKDTIDIASLIITCGEELHLSFIAGKVQASGLLSEFRERIEVLASQYSASDFKEKWESTMGQRLTGVQIQEIRQVLRRLNRLLS